MEMDSPKAAHHTEAGGGSLLVSVRRDAFRLSFREAHDAPTWTVGFGGGAISVACVKVRYQFRDRCLPLRRMKSAPLLSGWPLVKDYLSISWPSGQATS